MSVLAKAIKEFCVPKTERSVWGDGRVEISLECPVWGCMMQGKGGKTLETFKHAKDCPLSLLKKLGDTKQLHKVIAKDAHDLDYEGGGYGSCPICKGRTTWNGSNPKHRKNCPGGVAHRTAQDEWFR